MAVKSFVALCLLMLSNPAIAQQENMRVWQGHDDLLKFEYPIDATIKNASLNKKGCNGTIVFSVVEYDSLGVYRQEGEDENGKYELIYELPTNYKIVITDQELEVVAAGEGFIKEGNTWYAESKYSPIDPVEANELDGDRIGFKTMDFAPYYYTSGEASSMAGEIERLFAWRPLSEGCNVYVLTEVWGILQEAVSIQILESIEWTSR